MSKRTWLLLIGCLLLSPLAFAGKIYKWVDSQGQVHYGERPPTANQADEVKIHKGPAPSAPTSAAASQTPSASDFLEAKAKERKEKAEAGEKANKAKEIAKKNCDNARASMHSLNQGGRRYVMQPDGQRKYLDDADVQKRKQEAQAAIDKWCK